MPLQAGKDAMSENIRELMHAYDSTGEIGNTTPKSRAHARLIAVAIAESKAREGHPRKGTSP